MRLGNGDGEFENRSGPRLVLELGLDQALDQERLDDFGRGERERLRRLARMAAFRRNDRALGRRQCFRIGARPKQLLRLFEIIAGGRSDIRIGRHHRVGRACRGAAQGRRWRSPPPSRA
jgi:hypothetical protein